MSGYRNKLSDYRNKLSGLSRQNVGLSKQIVGLSKQIVGLSKQIVGFIETNCRVHRNKMSEYRDKMPGYLSHTYNLWTMMHMMHMMHCSGSIQHPTSSQTHIQPIDYDAFPFFIHLPIPYMSYIIVRSIDVTHNMSHWQCHSTRTIK
jgi:hypothetical protein